MIILLFFSFLAGIVTVLSPCILPVLPILLSGGAAKGTQRPFGIVLGLIISFTFFTLAFKTLVDILGINAEVLRIIAIVIIAFFGLTMMFPSLGNFLTRLMTPIEEAGTKLESQNQKHSVFLASFILGL